MSAADQRLEISRIIKRGGPLTKELSLAPDGKLRSDGSACVMSEGRARRAIYDTLADFARDIFDLRSEEAIALGALRVDLPDEVRVTTKSQINVFNGSAPADLITRTGDYISYKPDRRTLALIDIDTKGMPASVAARIRDEGGYWGALASVLPELKDAGRVIRRSTSTGIYRTDNGESVPGSDGTHVFVLVEDGSDVERFLRTLHARCWLSGFGWLMVGAGGQLLERSIVDRMVYAPERLVFEGAPVLMPPLAQHADGRLPIVSEGAALDTAEACPGLSIVEKSTFKTLRARETERLDPEAGKVRAAFIRHHAAVIAGRSGMPTEDAEQIVTRQTSGVLLPDIVLPFDKSELAGVTVGSVLADPRRYEGETLADPLEGIDYGECKARVMLRRDGTPWIHSFAHGRTIYELRHDARSVAAVLGAAPDSRLGIAFAQAMAIAEVDPAQSDALRDVVAKRTGSGKRAIDRQVKQVRATQDAARRLETTQRRDAARTDKRPRVPAPPNDAPWLPQMDALNEVMGASSAREPPMRDIDGVMTMIRTRCVPDMHALTPAAANGDHEETNLPPPEQPLLTRLGDVALAELIEKHIDYVDQASRSVHLATPFVRHYLTRTDDKLPTVAAVATLPLVLSDGTMLASHGLDRRRGIVFRIPAALLKILPDRNDCTPGAVAEAMRFLTDDWLADVSTDYIGKCILIAAAMTVIERPLLPDRPAFFVTAGRRGGGKTTTLIMLLVAVTGVRPSAAAWSTNEEERRKALLAYLAEAVPAIIWDNITRGSQISCPHIEKACTSAFYSDRRLGVTELISVAASSIHFFTGNNIGPRGDLASRSLQARLEIDRSDPENRDFSHPDPIGWTENNRAAILRALYTIMLGNPSLRPEIQPRTRFKAWWRVIGSAVEAAAARHAEHLAALAIDATACSPRRVDFRDLFLRQEADEEETASLTAALEALHAMLPSGFKATDLADKLNSRSEYRLDAEIEQTMVVREFLFPTAQSNHDVSSKGVGKALQKHAGEPVTSDDKTLILKSEREKKGGPKGPLFYRIHSRKTGEIPG